MSYTLASEREQEAVEGAVASPEGQSARLLLLVGGEDYSERLEEGEWGQAEIPYSLDATLSGMLPRRLENEEVRLSVEIAGVVVSQMVGFLSMSEIGDDLVSTDLLTASVGALFGGQNAVKIGEDLAFGGHSPQYIVRDAVYRLPYDRGLVRIDVVESPVLSYDADEGFRPEEEAGAILDRVGELGLYLFRDTVDGGFAATALSPLSRRAPARVYAASDMPAWRPPARAELYYSDVVVFSPQARFDPVSAPVEYRHLSRPPFARQTKYVPLPDPTEAGGESASQRAFDEAGRLMDLTHRSKTALPAFDPLAEKGDPFRVEETFRDDDGTWERAWLCEVEGIKHRFAAALDTVVNYAGTIVEEELIRVPAFLAPRRFAGISAGVMKTAPPAYGSTLDGRPFVDDEVAPWAVYDPETNEVVIDEEMAREFGLAVYFERTPSGDYQLVIEETEE